MRVLILAIALAAGGCGHGSTTPVAPSSAASVAPPAPAAHVFATAQLSGVVRDELGQPVAGATVTVDGSAPVMTDANGSYATPAAVDTFYQPPGLVWLTIRKSGYDDTRNVGTLPGFHDGTADFHLFKLPALAAATQQTFPLAFDGPLCGFDGEYPCRHVNVTTPASGTLLVDVA